MMLVGCGGWQYFNVGAPDPLEWYARAYDFVEVNSSFYAMPSIKTVKSWRERVPQTFEFTVRAHRDLTHVYALMPQKESFLIWERMKEICKTLGSRILVLVTPWRLDVGQCLEPVRDFFSSVDKKDLRVAWEMRCYKDKDVPQSVLNLMLDYDIVHCVDLSTSVPSHESDITYARLFGKGRGTVYQFSDEELSDMNARAENFESKRKYMNFHGVRMYKDAARLILFRKTGRFPRVTNRVGQKSLEEILGEDASFPTTKQELLEAQGWKLFDKSEEKRVRVSEILQGIPERTYASVQDVLRQVELG